MKHWQSNNFDRNFNLISILPTQKLFRKTKFPTNGGYCTQNIIAYRVSFYNFSHTWSSIFEKPVPEKGERYSHPHSYAGNHSSKQPYNHETRRTIIKIIPRPGIRGTHRHKMDENVFSSDRESVGQFSDRSAAPKWNDVIRGHDRHELNLQSTTDSPVRKGHEFVGYTGSRQVGKTWRTGRI